MLDASKLRGEVGGLLQERPYIVTNELLYADESMLIGSDASADQAHLDSVTTVGQTYGLELNVEKTILLRIRGTLDIYGADGKPLAVKEEAICLGSLISADGRTPRELSRKLGEAQQLSQKLEAIWKHANISEKRKACIFEACVVTKLLYDLESMWLLQAARTRLDGFYAKCLRRIARILPAYFSRIPNQVVIDRFGAKPLSAQLLSEQVQYYKKLCAQDARSLTRQIALEPEGVAPRSWASRRRVGRPCLRWASCVYAQALHVLGD